MIEKLSSSFESSSRPVTEKKLGKVLARRDGASIVIALGLVAVIMFFTIGIASTMIAAIRNTRNAKEALQAEYAAQSGVEKSLFSLSEVIVPFDTIDSGDGVDLGNGVTVEYEVVGQDTDPATRTSGGFRYVPVIARGNAGDDCSFVAFDVIKADLHHPCNWNKLHYGESVDIPLYLNKTDDAPGDRLNPRYTYVDSSDSYIEGGIDLYFTYLYLRTPCVGEQTSSCTRYDVIPVDPDDLVVSWQIAGNCVAKADGVSSPCAIVQAFEGNVPANKESAITVFEFAGDDIYELTLAGEEYNIWGTDLEETQGAVFDFIKSKGAWSDSYLDKPVLKLSFLKEIFDDAGEDLVPIPYLEYRIGYESEEGLASSYYVNVDGFSNLFKYSMSSVQNMNSALFDFAVQN